MHTQISHNNSLLIELLLFCLLCGSLFADESNKSDSILILGDSLSDAYGLSPEQGWVNLLEDRLLQQSINSAIINASASGETTRGGAARLPALLAEHKPSLVIIELGGNDGLRGISPVEIEKNLVNMIENSVDAGAKVLLLAVRIPPNYGRAYSQKFENVFQKVSRQEGVPLVPRFLEGIAEDRQLMQEDGIHPNADAQSRMLENIWPELVETIKK